MIKQILILSMLFLVMSLSVLAGNHLNNRPETTGKPEVVGLELALEILTSQVAKNQLQINIDSIQDKLEEVKSEIKGNRTVITGKGTAKLFGLFSVKLTHVFDIDEDGNLIRRNRFIDIFFRGEKEGFE